MDEANFNETVERLKSVNQVIEALDPAIRASAFEILRPYVDVSQPTRGERKTRAKRSAPRARTPRRAKSPSARAQRTTTPKAAVLANVDTTSVESFVRTLEPGKPADTVYAIAAWWYSQYGAAPLTRAQIESIASEIGVTVSARPDVTLRTSQKAGKGLFRRSGDGYVPTVPHGELHLKNEYGVTKGTKKPPSTDPS